MDNCDGERMQSHVYWKGKILCQCPLHSIKLTVSTEAKESSVTIHTSVSTSPQYEPADKKMKSMVKLQDA